MNRRELLGGLCATIALPVFAGLPADGLWATGRRVHARARGRGRAFQVLDPHESETVATIAEMIIPETDTPGATSVRVPEFIDLILTEWASEDERAPFLAGLADIDKRAATLGASRFVDLPTAKKAELLTALDGARDDKTGAGLAFARLKALTVYGYFTSKVVDQDILKTEMFFNGYQGNVPFTPAV